MAAYKALIERTNRKDLDHVEVQVTITDQSAGRQSWEASSCPAVPTAFSPTSAWR